MAFKYTGNNKESFNRAFNFTSNPVEQDKKRDEAFFCALGDSFMLKNEYQKAVKEYLVSLMIDKNNLHASKGASKAYKNLRKYDKAIKHLKNARNLHGFDSEVYYELGLNYLLNADNLNAQKNFIRTIKLEPDNKSAQIKLALTHELSGEDEMAILVYKTIIERNPNYIPAMSNLAGLYIERAEFEEALVLFRRILKINSQYYRAYLGMGLCFDKLEKYSSAIRYYKKYICHKPHGETTKSLVGRIYEIHRIKTETKTSSGAKGGDLRIVKTKKLDKRNVRSYNQ